MALSRLKSEKMRLSLLFSSNCLSAKVICSSVIERRQIALCKVSTKLREFHTSSLRPRNGTRKHVCSHRYKASFGVLIFLRMAGRAQSYDSIVFESHTFQSELCIGQTPFLLRFALHLPLKGTLLSTFGYCIAMRFIFKNTSVRPHRCAYPASPPARA
jgi:hypothetical protein